jgi:Transposase domain (DUF772)
MEMDRIYAHSGRPSPAPEYILRTLLLQVFYSVRAERLLVEQIDYDLPFWSVWPGQGWRGVEPCRVLEESGPVADSALAKQFFAEVNRRAKRFMSDEHFTVDGALIRGRRGRAFVAKTLR